MRYRTRAKLRAVLTFALLLSAGALLGADWPQYRGPTHNGVSTDRIRTDWTGAVTNPVWRILQTNSIASLTVVNGRVFTQARRAVNGASMEVCIALDAITGSELWAKPVDTASYPHGGVGFDDGPRSTPVVDGEGVFVLTSYMKLYRFNAADGEFGWMKDLRQLYGSLIIPWQNAASPLIENGLIYLNANSRTDTLFALQTSDGSLGWRTQNEALTHSTPVLATIHGVRQVIFATQSGLVSLNPTSGSLLWKYTYPFDYGTSLGTSPVVCDDMVFVCGAQVYQMGSVTVRVSFSNNVWSTTHLWSSLDPSAHWMTPVCKDGYLYGQFGIMAAFDSVNAQFKCVRMSTGSVLWSTNGFGRCAPVQVDDHLVILTERGHLVLADLDPTGYRERGRFIALPFWNGNTNKCWNGPAVADGRIYARSTSYVACFDLSLTELMLNPPLPQPPDHLQLTISTTTGAPIDSNRLAGLELRMSDDAAQPLDQWLLITNTPVLSEGELFFNDIEVGPSPQRFFILVEPP